MAFGWRIWLIQHVESYCNLIKRIYYVVDLGFAKHNVYNAKFKLDSLVITPFHKLQQVKEQVKLVKLDLVNVIDYTFKMHIAMQCCPQ